MLNPLVSADLARSSLVRSFTVYDGKLMHIADLVTTIFNWNTNEYHWLILRTYYQELFVYRWERINDCISGFLVLHTKTYLNIFKEFSARFPSTQRIETWIPSIFHLYFSWEFIMESFGVLLPLFDLAGICFIVSHAETILDPVIQVQHFACVRVLYFLGVKDVVETRLNMVMVNFRLHVRLLAYCITVIPRPTGLPSLQRLHDPPFSLPPSCLFWFDWC